MDGPEDTFDIEIWIVTNIFVINYSHVWFKIPFIRMFLLYNHAIYIMYIEK